MLSRVFCQWGTGSEYGMSHSDRPQSLYTLRVSKTSLALCGRRSTISIGTTMNLLAIPPEKSVESHSKMNSSLCAHFIAAGVVQAAFPSSFIVSSSWDEPRPV